ncbi:CoA ester lyase [Paraburkholderia sp. BL10I2N1]|uniref:HpcH/HpaI aldolase/citrate lyase family protein n=1 Tax=Paraburkholderia sp. BL10I2N1 TaxID=1938796 RepID=UPI0010F2A9C0|nr:CoA ester lyase [Paraburkholderia sp. BL10I2N1]TDN61410.1 citrate lyase subunit beta/citryl-CoA lyase [Paraburkholderia sp. BL10I2N1]
MKRTWLFVPADDEAKVAKALASSADAVILDLEDGVGRAPGRKAGARTILTRVLERNDIDRTRCYVRLNALASHEIGLDIPVAVAGGATGVVLPKCEGPADVMRLAELLSEAEQRCNRGNPASIVAIATETARGVQLLPTFLHALPRLEALMWGAEDLCSDLGGFSNRGLDGSYLGPYATARDSCLVAARAAGALAIDAVYTAFRDIDGLRRESEMHRSLGFDAKAAIHPAQLDTIKQSFRPTPAQIDWALRLMEFFAEGDGARALDGAMIDEPHVRLARKILESR